MKIYRVRHGETDWNKAGKLQGQSDVPLNEYGIRLARETAAGLAEVPFEAVFSSPLGRAVETARVIVGERQIPLYLDDRLKEIGFGGMEATDYREAKRDAANPMHNFFCAPAEYIPPERAESFQQLYSRSAEFLQEQILPLEGKYETVLIVGHGAMNRSILNPLAGVPLENFWRIGMPNCAVSLLALNNGKLSIVEESRVYYEGVTGERP